MAYTDQTEYAKYLASELSEDSGCSECGDKEKSDCGKETCGCCPPGLVEHRDADGNTLGCITPNDSEQLFKGTIKCPEGYIKVLDDSGNFVGCLTPVEFQTYKTALAVPL